ncbi:SET and MYND domain-containing protein DDB_G0273589-like [Nasonia vitripennis]|uniref:SET and MYND domain-containing protein 4 n=1 Tax=Nasonia vitripennis TaxID=7425 RepID=A0A7M7IVA2_NASVI|nr:SET and MYND domain-containing protein DDB_G0273589-like [Nasonia vitripennis]XP_031789581.1 SET and MYND domain-containing protein DDB_G0273589-like [Nasonia vitripennis]
MEAFRRQNFNHEVAREVKQGNVLRKCSILSTNPRQRGNELYKSKKHDSKIHETILSLYSESIAFAPEGSEELALGYSNRSALLLHLHRPKNSLIDIARALKMTKSTDLRRKLFSRKANCLELIDKSTDPEDYDTSDELEIPAFTPSKEVPCAADCVKIVYNKQFGRHIIATRDIEPGEVITAETSYAAFPNGNQLYLNCSHCLCLAWNGIPCDSCAHFIFCSEECKKEAWNAYHDIECRIIPYIFLNITEKSNYASIMTSARIFITAAKKEGIKNMLEIAESIDKQDSCTSVWSNKGFNYETFSSCYNLITHENSFEHEQIYKCQANIILNLLYTYTDIINTLQKTDSDAKNSYDIVQIFSALEKILIKLLKIVAFNSYGYEIHHGTYHLKVKNQFLMPDSVKGIIVTLFSAFFNHSCYPNISRIFMPKRKMATITILPVKKGEQLSIDYGVSIVTEKQGRQAYLKHNYHFTCECEGCKNDLTARNLLKLVPDHNLNCSSKFLYEYYKIVSSSLKRHGELTMDAESIKTAIEICKLLRKNLKDHDALRYSYQYSCFLADAFVYHYQEKCKIPDKC